MITQELLNESLEIREGLDGLSPTNISILYRRAPLHRRTQREEDLWSMYKSSSLVLSAWFDGRLVGIARVLTDGFENAILCDFAVEPDVQRLGVGKKLISELQVRIKGADLFLRDSFVSANYYEKFGFKKEMNAWITRC